MHAHTCSIIGAGYTHIANAESCPGDKPPESKQCSLSHWYNLCAVSRPGIASPIYFHDSSTLHSCRSLAAAPRERERGTLRTLHAREPNRRQNAFVTLFLCGIFLRIHYDIHCTRREKSRMRMRSRTVRGSEIFRENRVSGTTSTRGMIKLNYTRLASSIAAFLSSFLPPAKSVDRMVVRGR